MATTTIQPLPYPAPGDSPDVPRDIKALAEAVEGRLVMRFASLAARDAALPSGKRASGMFVYVEATATFYAYIGTAWVPVLSDTGWVNVTPAAGFTSVGAQVRLRNGVIAYRGSFSGGALSTAGTVVGTVPAGYRPPGGADDSVSSVGLGSGALARATISSSGAITVIPSANVTSAVYLKGLSGYLVD